VLPGYSQQTIGLGPDPDGEGDLVATLVRRGEPDPSATHAVLLVHGFTGLLLQHRTGRPLRRPQLRVYALDMNKCGRSWREGRRRTSPPTWRYDTELERALDLIAEASPAKVLVYGHPRAGSSSRCGLTGCAVAAAQRNTSPAWCSTVPGWICRDRRFLRTAPTRAAIGAISRVRKKRVVPASRGASYGATLHRDYAGDFDYDLNWKPIGGFPVTFGWIQRSGADTRCTAGSTSVCPT
jgi:alpha-beta hydrolase superfamily lysophospholipase